jgi:hypothetical protein
VNKIAQTIGRALTQAAFESILSPVEDDRHPYGARIFLSRRPFVSGREA